jgi:glycosyltransferase involved in cell wall biosynthesis
MLAKAWEIDIAGPWPSLYLDPRYSRLDLLVLDGNRPLAVLALFPETGRIISHSQMEKALAGRSLTVPFTPLENTIAAALPGISVVVCTRDRPLSLANCLRTLRALDYPEYEVIVVDNKSSSPQVYDTVLRSGFRYVREETVGLNWARNRGAAEARFEIVAYIDDDATASRGWLKGLAAGFADPEVSAVTGLVLPAELETEAQILFEQYGGMAKGFEVRRTRPENLSARNLIGVHQYGLGANMAYRKSVFSTAGMFDTALDVGTPSSGGGDLDMFHRLLASGLHMAYEPTAWVRHRHRRDREGLRRQIHANGRSFGVYLLKTWSRKTAPHGAVASYALTWFTSWILWRSLRSALRRRGSMPFDISWAELRGTLGAPFVYLSTYHHDQKCRGSKLRSGQNGCR